MPLKASSRLILTSYLKSFPRLLDLLVDPPPPKSPKKSSKISEKDEVSKPPKPYPPPLAPSNAACPN